jgi:hypothetical protein
MCAELIFYKQIKQRQIRPALAYYASDTATSDHLLEVVVVVVQRGIIDKLGTSSLLPLVWSRCGRRS